jgi:hypothetical protein
VPVELGLHVDGPAKPFGREAGPTPVEPVDWIQS